MNDKITKENENVITIEDDDDSIIPIQTVTEKIKPTKIKEIQFLGEFGNFRKSKRRVYMTIRNESIAAMRLTIRRSINSQFYYHLLMREVMKLYESKTTILCDTQFEIFTSVFEDIYQIELLYKENYQKRISCQRKPHELITRPKSLVSLVGVIENARLLALRSDSPSLKKFLQYLGQRNKAPIFSRPPPNGRSNRRTPYNKQRCIKYYTLEKLIFKLSQPVRYENLIYSDDSND